MCVCLTEITIGFEQAQYSGIEGATVDVGVIITQGSISSGSVSVQFQTVDGSATGMTVSVYSGMNLYYNYAVCLLLHVCDGWVDGGMGGEYVCLHYYVLCVMV